VGRKTKSDKFTNTVITILLILLAFLFLYPIWFVVIASFSDPAAIAAGEVLLIPKNFTLAGYKKILEYKSLWQGYGNSLFYLFFGSFVTLVVTLPAAYALSRKELRGRKVINTMFIISMYFSGGLIPTYLLHSTIGWIDTIWVLIVPSALSVYYMILARSAFEALPESLYESVLLDGGDDFHYFFRFALPLCKATIAVIFLFSALTWWNEYIRFVIYIETPEMQSLQVMIRQITNELTASLSDTASLGASIEVQKQMELMKYCVVVIAAIPFVILYPFIQKYFNKGVMIGAVKG